MYLPSRLPRQRWSKKHHCSSNSEPQGPQSRTTPTPDSKPAKHCSLIDLLSKGPGADAQDASQARARRAGGARARAWRTSWEPSLPRIPTRSGASPQSRRSDVVDEEYMCIVCFQKNNRRCEGAPRLLHETPRSCPTPHPRRVSNARASGARRSGLTRPRLSRRVHPWCEALCGRALTHARMCWVAELANSLHNSG